MQERAIPAPAVTPENRPFWEGAAAGQLLLKRCGGCTQFHYYPRSMCPHCGSFDTHWYASSGHGHVYTLSVLRAAAIPYAIGYVTLEEGVRVLTNFVDVDVDALAIGQPVKVAFRHSDSGVVVPVFTPR